MKSGKCLLGQYAAADFPLRIFHKIGSICEIYFELIVTSSPSLSLSFNISLVFQLDRNIGNSHAEVFMRKDILANPGPATLVKKSISL